MEEHNQESYIVALNVGHTTGLHKNHEVDPADLEDQILLQCH